MIEGPPSSSQRGGPPRPDSRETAGELGPLAAAGARLDEQSSPWPETMLAMLDGHPVIEGLEIVDSGASSCFRRGGQAVVYMTRAANGSLRAAKLPRLDRLAPEFRRYWSDECNFALTLPPHDHLVIVYGLARARWGSGLEVSALVMEWLEGDLNLVTAAEKLGLEKPGRVELFRQALEGVAHLHSHGITHVDLKPANLLVVERGGRATVKVTDLGAVRLPRGCDGRVPVFTVLYVAPEVRTGDAAAIDPRADVYSLGKILLELIAGSDSIQSPGADAAAWRAAPIAAHLGLSDPALDALIEGATKAVPGNRSLSGVPLNGAGDMLKVLASYQPPLLQRLVRRVQGRLLPDQPVNLPGRRLWSGLLVVLLALVLGWLAMSSIRALAVRELGPEFTLAPIVPAGLANVAIVRARSGEEFVELAQALGIPGVEAHRAKSWRPVWAAVMRGLVPFGPRAIAADIVFVETGSGPDDEVIADAIREIRGASSIPVVVACAGGQPHRADRHATHPVAAEIIEAKASWGSRDVYEFRGLGPSVVTLQSFGRRARVPLAVAIACAVLDDGAPAEPVLDRAARALHFLSDAEPNRPLRLAEVLTLERVQGRSIEGALPGDLVGVYPVGLPADAAMEAVECSLTELVLGDEKTRNRLRTLIRDRVVLLAPHLEMDAVEIGGRQMPGVWMHAAATEAVLAGMDAPSVGWEWLLPAGLLALLGLLVGGLLGANVVRRAGLGYPSPTAARSLGHWILQIPLGWLELGGGWKWRPAPLRPHAAVQRWTLLAAVLIGTLILVVSLAVLVPPRLDLSLPYRPSVLALSMAIGAVAGVILALIGAWMAIVRRAWCLDVVHSCSTS